ncbi:MAG: PorT family protein [Flavobacteriales bacterium]|nr:PorT family protein [Flavobacteriales bacterium]
MRKWWVLILIFSLGYLCLKAQPVDSLYQRKTLRIGISAGANVCNLLANNTFYTDLYKWRFQFYGAIFQDIRLKKNFLFMHTELNYSAMGTMQNIYVTNYNGDTLGPGKFKYNLHYIQIPILIKFKLGKKIRYYGEVGPYIGFLVAAKGGIDPDYKTETIFPLYNLSDNYHIIDAGLKAGIGVEIPILNGQSLLIGMRYTQGFVDISRFSPRDWNIGIGFHLGYMFDI